MKKKIIPMLMLGLMMSSTAKAQVTDLETSDNIIYVVPTTVEVGTSAKLSFNMKNSAAIRGFQFDLYLPDGVKAVVNSKGRIQASLSVSRLEADDEHTLTMSTQDDGAIRFLCGSQYEETFTGNTGEVATLTISVAEDMAVGNYPIVLKQMKLSENDIRNYYETERVETTLTVNLTTGVTELRNNLQANPDPIYNMSGQRMHNLQKGVNIVGGRKIVIQ